MTRTENNNINPLKNSALKFHQWLITVLAGFILILIIVINIVFWPISDLGFQVDPRTAIILSVDPNRPAHQVGLQAGDRVISIYGIIWSEIITQKNLLKLIGPPNKPVLIFIERANTISTYELAQSTPSTSFQINKAVRLCIALVCWITGYVLGIVRRHEASGSQLVATFWLGLSCVLGSLFFAVHASYILSLILYWFTITILFPLFIYIHIYFPVRTKLNKRHSNAKIYLLGSWFVLNSLIVLFIVFSRPSLPDLLINLSFTLPLVLVMGFLGTATILFRSYLKTNTIHTRRQIRIISMTCFFVAAFWLLTLIIPKLMTQDSLIEDYWIDLVAGTIPMAYLISGITTDLYRIDRVIIRISIHLATILLIMGIITTFMDLLTLQGEQFILWGTVVFVALYNRTKSILMSVFSRSLLTNPYTVLHHIARELTTTLETIPLVNILCNGIRSTFGQPALAFYIANAESTNELTLLLSERLPDLPASLSPGRLTDHLSQLSTVTESRILVDGLAQVLLNMDEELTLRHPGIVLWCPIRHTEGHLLGVLLLGMRGDFDPYRNEDIRELQRLIHAAVLAFSNSATYARHRNAETIIRQLYHQLQYAQDKTAAAIARELHDEIINYNVRLNIESLKKLLVDMHDPTLRDELALILEGERNVSHALRVICEQLHPTGIDDPLGLPSVLRLQVEKIQASWSGICRLVIENKPCPLLPQVQHEALRIVRESLINAVKHAQATEIIVCLQYPLNPDGNVRLSVQDNGTSGLIVKAKPGHFGFRNMEESARAAGGTLQFSHNKMQGTTITFSFAAPFIKSDTQSHMFVEV
jgi:signal transduction histidine kinase